jgi:hypothetical protein
MTHRKLFWLPAAFAALVLSVADSSARAPDETKPAVKPSHTKPAATTALTSQTLLKLLTDMGYEPKKINDLTFDLKIQRDGWTIYLRLFLTADQTRVWLTSTLETIPDINKVPAEVLAKLVQGNATYSPCFFYFEVDPKNKDWRRLRVANPVDNRGITAAVLRAEIDRMVTNIKNSKPLWKASEWKTAKPAVTPPKTVK